VLGVEVTGKNAKFRDGIEIRHDSRRARHGFLDVGSVQDEPVGRFALPVDGDIAGIQSAGGSDGAKPSGSAGAGGDICSGGIDAALNRQQIGITAPTQGDFGDSFAVDRLAELRIGLFHFNLGGFFGDINGRRLPGQLEDDIHLQRAVDVDGEPAFAIGRETRSRDFDVVTADGECRQRIDALIVGGGGLFDASGRTYRDY